MPERHGISFQRIEKPLTKCSTFKGRGPTPHECDPVAVQISNDEVVASPGLLGQLLLDLDVRCPVPGVQLANGGRVDVRHDQSLPPRGIGVEHRFMHELQMQSCAIP